MRILLVGVAAVALSGCSWLSGGYQYNQGYGASAPSQQKPLSRYSLTGAIGTDYVVGGTAITGNDTPGLVNVHQVPMQDAYKMGYRAEGGGTYMVNRKQHITLNGFYQEADGKADVVIANDPTDIFTGEFSKYKAYGVEAGFRHDLGNTKVPLLRTVLPYMEGRVGISKTSSIDLQNTAVNGTATGNPAIQIYEGRLVPTASALVGLEKPITRRMSLGLETGLRYIGENNPDDTFTTGTFLSEGNNGSSRWSVPVQLRARYRF